VILFKQLYNQDPLVEKILGFSIIRFLCWFWLRLQIKVRTMTFCLSLTIPQILFLSFSSSTRLCLKLRLKASAKEKKVFKSCLYFGMEKRLQPKMQSEIFSFTALHIEWMTITLWKALQLFFIQVKNTFWYHSCLVKPLVTPTQMLNGSKMVKLSKTHFLWMDFLQVLSILDT